MGKSTSCFKIIACGGDSSDKDDIDISESKRLNDKQGWSFRKRSNRQRVLSNTVIAEIPSPGNKETFETVNINFQPPTNGSILEKDPGLQCASEKPQLQSTENLKQSEVVDVIQKESKVDVDIEEHSVIIIQAVVRRWLARGELLKLKNVVKLQAAIRGHLVRKHAVETLRCIQAIIKLQALVRARCAHLALERSNSEELDSNSYKTLVTPLNPDLILNFKKYAYRSWLQITNPIRHESNANEKMFLLPLLYFVSRISGEGKVEEIKRDLRFN